MGFWPCCYPHRRGRSGGATPPQAVEASEHAGRSALLLRAELRPATTIVGGAEALGSATTAATNGAEESCSQRGPVSRGRSLGVGRHQSADDGCSRTTGDWVLVAARTRKCDRGRAAACRARRAPPRAARGESMAAVAASRAVERASAPRRRLLTGRYGEKVWRLAREEARLQAATELRGPSRRGGREPQPEARRCAAGADPQARAETRIARGGEDERGAATGRRTWWSDGRGGPQSSPPPGRAVPARGLQGTRDGSGMATGGRGLWSARPWGCTPAPCARCRPLLSGAAALLVLADALGERMRRDERSMWLKNSDRWGSQNFKAGVMIVYWGKPAILLFIPAVDDAIERCSLQWLRAL